MNDMSEPQHERYLVDRINNVEVQLGRVDERIKALDNKQDLHHGAILDKLSDAESSIMDLKNNFASRLERLETQKYAATDFIAFRNQEFIPLSRDVKALMQYRWIMAGVIMAASVIAPFVWQLAVKLIGK